jgi:hypothetical protein
MSKSLGCALSTEKYGNLVLLIELTARGQLQGPNKYAEIIPL